MKQRLFVLVCFVATAAYSQQNSGSAPPSEIVPAKFVDVTSQAGIHFMHQAPHTSRKYLIETMGSGVALFDCDNDGLLDVFLVNGAPFSDPTPKGLIPQKTGPEYWNRLYHQKTGWDVRGYHCEGRPRRGGLWHGRRRRRLRQRWQ